LHYATFDLADETPHKPIELLRKIDEKEGYRAIL
jgi:hypothetical protein